MASDSKFEKQFKKAKKLHLKGIDGDKKAVKNAYKMFIKLQSSYPDGALIVAYLGSSLVLLARDTSKIIDKENKALEGLDKLNHAIAIEPNHKEIRLLRANVCLRLPDSYFNCAKTAIEDYSFLLDRYKEDPNYLSKKQANKIIRDLSKAYINDGNSDKAKDILVWLSHYHPKVK